MKTKKKPAVPRPRMTPPPGSIDADYGPGTERETSRAQGPIPGLACAGERCLLKPAADLVTRFATGLGRRGHGSTLARAALSGIELMKALRDFLDEEIALAEKAAGRDDARPRYSKIEVE